MGSLGLGLALAGQASRSLGEDKPEIPAIENRVERDDLFGLKIDAGAKALHCRSLPFLACLPEERGQTSRVIDKNTELIPVGAAAKAVYLLGMINDGWDCGQDWWGGHNELQANRDDQVYVGKAIGQVEIRYTDGQSDQIPLIIGATAWFYQAWGSIQENIYGGTPIGALRQPFASRPELMSVLRRSLRLHESDAIEKYPSRRAPGGGGRAPARGDHGPGRAVGPLRRRGGLVGLGRGDG